MTGQYPGLRRHVRKRKSGRVVVYYFLDRRAAGLPDLPLGSDWDQAVKLWHHHVHEVPVIVGTLKEALDAWEARALPGYKKLTKEGYTKGLRRLRPAFEGATWDGVTLKDLRDYMQARKGKTQANREISLLSVIWNWARVEGYTDLQFPAAGLKGSRYKNKEKARTFVPDAELFSAVYDQADQVLKDTMDLASAAGLRLTDCVTVLLPRGDILHLDASKTGKPADYDLSLSDVLPDLLARRRSYKADHLMLISTPTGRPVSLGMLRTRWDAARTAAIKKATEDERHELAAQIKDMWLRDMRKMASWLSPSLDDAAELLQHSSKATTQRHYPTRGRILKPVR